MIDITKSRWNLKTKSSLYDSYLECISDLIQDDNLYVMAEFPQHGEISCLEHCFYVSYMSYWLSRAIGLDYRSAARGGLLHDFFLYDWHTTKPERGLHGLTHPQTALDNASKRFRLNSVEKDIIAKHMWPLTVIPPVSREALLVSFIDKYCALIEAFGVGSRIGRLMCELRIRTDIDSRILETI